MQKHIFIIGFMAVGKTVLGKALAQKTSLPFIDTDTEIEKYETFSIPSIFNKYGEHYFRELEHKFIHNLPSIPHIISCGGGLPCFHDHILLLKQQGKIIFLDANMDIIYQRIQADRTRPLAIQKTKEELHSLKTSRELYYKMADIFLTENYIISEIEELLK